MYLLGTVEQVVKTEVNNRTLQEENCRRALSISLKELKQQIIDVQVYGTHSGRVVNRKNFDGGTAGHITSAPGESPSPNTFALVNSTKTEMFDSFNGEVRVEKAYGYILEQYRNRPFFKNTVEKYRAVFTENVRKATVINRNQATD